MGKGAANVGSPGAGDDGVGAGTVAAGNDDTGEGEIPRDCVWTAGAAVGAAEGAFDAAPGSFTG